MDKDAERIYRQLEDYVMWIEEAVESGNIDEALSDIDLAHDALTDLENAIR